MTNPKTDASSDEAGFKRLVVLESEYRTHRPADQLHAIASFPQLFEEFPNPVIINSAFLKLADYFRGTTNVQRHAILQVFKKSEAHLKFILNVEETIRRISPMLQSNDPLGRAITLRVLGCMASIVHDRVDVYHNVIHCLDSTEAMEVSAAIYVADRICAHSQKFCAIISGKLAFMIRDPKVALPYKRRLIRIFGHMFEDITLARLARKTCLEMLELNQDAEYTVAILKTLTRLASYSLVDVHQQIELLLQMAWSHGVQGIPRVALMCLGSLASKNVDFEPSQLRRLFEIASKSGDEKTSIRAMSVLSRLFQSTYLVSGLILEDGGEQTLIEFLQLAVGLLRQECHAAPSTTALGENFKLVSTVLECYRTIAKDGIADLAQLRSVFDESLQAVVARIGEHLTFLWELKQPPPCHGDGDQLSLHRGYLNMYITVALWDNELVPQILRQFANWLQLFPHHDRLLLGAFHRVAQQRPLDVQLHQEGLLLYLTQKNQDAATIDSESFVMACKALLTANSVRTSVATEPFVSKMTEHLHKFGGWNNMTEQYTKHHWELYHLGREALRSGWPQLAHVALYSLSGLVESVPCRQWIGALQELAQAESYLSDTLASSLASSDSTGNGSGHDLPLDLSMPQQLYARAVGRLEEMALYQHRGSMDRAFQVQYCQLRAQVFQACRRILILLQQTPMLSLASGGGGGGGLPGTITPLLQCAATLNEIAHHYTLMKLQVAHHPPSELALEVLQTMCLVLAFFIQRVARSSSTTAGATTASNNPAGIATEPQVFNIDPLLIPLLYVDSTAQFGGSSAMTTSSDMDIGETGRQGVPGDGGGGDDGEKTAKNLFRASVGRLLRYVEETMDNKMLSGAQRYTVAKQTVLQLLTMPVPFPARFFNSV